MPRVRPSSARSRRVGALVVAVAGIVALVAGCSGGSASTATTTTTTTTAKLPTSPPTGLEAIVANGAPPPAPVPRGGCPVAPGPSVTITVDDSGFRPRCVQIRASQTLDVVNRGDMFHNVSIQDLAANVEPGEDQAFGKIARYLPPGAYSIFSTSDVDRTVSSPWIGRLIVTR